MMQRYEIEIDVWADEEGTENILAPYKHPEGDWVMASDAIDMEDYLEAENELLGAENDALREVIENNEYKMRTVWYRGREWASLAEVDALCRAEVTRLRARRSEP